MRGEANSREEIQMNNQLEKRKEAETLKDIRSDVEKFVRIDGGRR